MKLPSLQNLSNIQVLFAFLFCAIILRFFTFFPSVINHDESTYIIIAQSILQGKTYWIDFIDTKPVGIFLLFAGFESLFGYNVLPIRILTAVWIALTSFFIFLVVKKIGGSKKAGISGGLAYIIMTSFFTFFGLSPNTELYFVLFTIIGLYYILTANNNFTFILAGLCVGFGFLIKPVVLFDILALIALIFILHKKDAISFLKKSFLFGIGTLIPFASVAFYYYRIEAFDTFLFYSFEVSKNYFIDTNFTDNALFFIDFFGRFLPITIWFFFVLFSKKLMDSKFKFFFLIWSTLICVAILLPGKNFSHYTVQFMVPFALVAGFYFDKEKSANRFWQFIRKYNVGYILLGILIIVSFFIQKKDFIDKEDTPRIIANYLSDKLEENDLIFTGDAQHVIYTLTNTLPPTPYVHRGLIWTPSHQKALGINAEKEFEKIYNNPNLRFVIEGQNGSMNIPIENFKLDTIISDYEIFHRIRRSDY